MVTLDDIIKRSSYINRSNMNEEYTRYHNKTNLLLESNTDRFGDKKFILQQKRLFNYFTILAFCNNQFAANETLFHHRLFAIPNFLDCALLTNPYKRPR